MNRFLTIIASLLLLSGVATAQKKWDFKLGLGGALNCGNVSNMSLTNNGGVERNDSTLAFDAHYNILYSREKEIETNREFGAGLKFDVFQYDRFSPFFAAEYLTNHFKGYDSKLSLLVGAKYRIYTLPSVCDYSISAAYVCDFVDYYQATTLDTRVDRLSLRAKIKQKIGPAVSIKHTTFYQPSFKDFSGDYIITSVTTLSTQISRVVSFDVSFDYEYRSLVPEGTNREDIRTTVGLTMKF
ncbi:MAG: DUF481 domain-containing protein [Bacteroidales bacterium]|nr:DUF481 domain-containing protein [Candidatus Colimorpha onthohippi]